MVPRPGGCSLEKKRLSFRLVTRWQWLMQYAALGKIRICGSGWRTPGAVMLSDSAEKLGCYLTSLKSVVSWLAEKIAKALRKRRPPLKPEPVTCRNPQQPERSSPKRAGSSINEEDRNSGLKGRSTAEGSRGRTGLVIVAVDLTTKHE